MIYNVRDILGYQDRYDAIVKQWKVYRGGMPTTVRVNSFGDIEVVKPIVAELPKPIVMNTSDFYNPIYIG